MKFTVGWDNRALGLLAERWAESANAAAFADAVNEFERKLARSPENVGMPFDEADPPHTALLDLAFRMNRSPGEVRVFAWSQLRFVFSLYEADRTVTIWTVYEHFDETP